MSDTALTVYQRHFNFLLLTGLFCQLLAQIDGAPISDPVQLGTSGDVKDRADHLFETWGAMYGLDKNQTLPPRQLYRPEVLPAALDTPLAPHLEDCWLDRGGGGWDGMGENGQPLWWEDGVEGEPSPPWIRGCDDDNLPMTRQAQADIWRHQHPAMCRNASLKFVVARWLSGSMYGLGSQLHVITTLFSEAVANDRIFVFGPRSFVRARHAHCKALGQYGSLGCYFAPFTALACEKEALQLLAESEASNASSGMSARDLLRSDLRVVQVKFAKTEFKDSAGGGSRWGTPWLQTPISSERLGVVSEARNIPELWKKKLWWRSQVLRYMLRRPTPYLCHLTNSHRHEAFGEQVANQLARSELGMRRAARSSQALSANKVGEEWREYEALQKADLDFLSLNDDMESGAEPYMPRPIVSLHVRQGDKATEMKLVSFASHMWLAERIRFHNPQTRTVWLSTEMQSVVDQSKGYKDWRFHYTRNLRQFGTTKMYEYENAVGLEKLVGISFANLLISAQCDYFVGPLGSNWNRIINELRLTNGRLKSGYLTFAGWM